MKTGEALTNPAGGAAAAAVRYTQALLEVLGQRDPIAVLRGQEEELERRGATLAPDVFQRPEAPGRWSVRQVIQHLADSEIVSGYRIRLMLAADTPAIPGYDQNRWAEALHYGDGNWEDLHHEFATARRRTLRLLAGLTPEEWERGGHHSERGFESVAHLTRMLASHDLVHLRQIDRILAAHT